MEALSAEDLENGRTEQGMMKCFGGHDCAGDYDALLEDASCWIYKATIVDFNRDADPATREPCYTDTIG